MNNLKEKVVFQRGVTLCNPDFKKNFYICTHEKVMPHFLFELGRLRIELNKC